MLDTLLHPVVWSYGEQLALEPSLLARYAQARNLFTFCIISNYLTANLSSGARVLCGEAQLGEVLQDLTWQLLPSGQWPGNQ